METNFIALESTRLPGYPNAALTLDRTPLQIVDDENFDEQTDISNLTVATGVATVLFRWCPEAFYAFLDLDAWFSFTWILTIQDEMKIEIGRVENRVTMGTLDKDGDEWKLMITYDMSTSGPDRGAWIPNTSENMKDGQDIKDPEEIDRLGRAFVRDLCLNQRWFTGRKMKHELFVEYAPMDIWGDGIQMNPHWLYKSLDLSECSLCGKQAGGSLSRCSRCGTATYCSGVCQKLDWPVHKAICNLNLEERGKALHITQHGGLINWDSSRTGGDDEDVMSKNPNFAEPQRKRQIDTPHGNHSHPVLV